jgi:hypothetical protein
VTRLPVERFIPRFSARGYDPFTDVGPLTTTSHRNGAVPLCLAFQDADHNDVGDSRAVSQVKALFPANAVYAVAFGCGIDQDGSAAAPEIALCQPHPCVKSRR